MPRAASRAQELAGLVTPGNAVNAECCRLAPVSRKAPLNEMSPGMAFPFAVVFAWPDEGAAADEETGDELLEPAAPVAPAEGEPDELQAARATVSSRTAAAGKLRATAGRRITETADIGDGDCMKGV